MIWKNYQLGNTVSKTSEATMLWQTEKGIIEISKNTLAIPIKLSDKERGYVFHGNGKLLVDTIVETEEGAIGKPVEKELNDPFLMLGNVEEIQKHFTKAGEEDFAKMGYGNQQGFVDRAEELFNQFFKKEGMHGHQTLSGNRGFIFAFQNQTSKLDILVAKGSKLVYKAMDIVFVSNENKIVLKSPREVVCASNGKSVIIKK
jgi:hypothetical protein